MQFTPQEKKMIERLRKQERQWPRLRWFTLGAGILGALSAVFIGISLSKHLDTMLAVHDDFMSRAWLFGFALIWPKCLILLGCAALLIFWTIKD